MSNKVRPLFLAALMILSVILVAPAAQAADSDNDGVDDADDAFPDDPDEQYDSDSDGVGDNSDAFPEDSDESEDSDGDGVGDNSDAFPEDPDEQHDSDGDGVGDNSDAFPEDPDEQYDSDGDGMPDGWESDNGLDPEDGNDAASDVDGDGLTSLEEYHYGTNPNNADTDGDGTIDSNDALPNDPDEQSDSDGDGVGDNSDTFPEDPDESEDTDNDGVGDNSDCDPEDSAVTYTNNPVSCSGFTELSYPYVAQAGSSDPPGLYDVHFAVLETEGDQCTECSNEEIDLMSSSGTLDIGDVNEFQNWSEQHEFEEFYFQYIDDNRNEQYDSGEIYVISCESSPIHMAHVVIADGRIYAYDFEQFWPDAYGINIVNEDDDDDDDDDDDQDSDIDGDGYLDEDDAFPENPDEWADEDNDGVGSNSDCDDFDSGETRTHEEGCDETMYVQYKEYRGPCSNQSADGGNDDNNTGAVEDYDCWDGYLRADKNEVRIVLEELDDELQYKLTIRERMNNEDYEETIFDYLVTEEGHQEMYDERIHINSEEPQYICHREIEITLFSITPNTTEQSEVHHWHDSNGYNCESRPQPYVMLTHGSIDGEEIRDGSSDSLFVQGASVDLSFKVHNLESETNYSLQWRVTDEMNEDGQTQTSYFHNETLESISSNNSDGTYEHYWTLNIPSDSCLVELEFVLAELDYDGVNEKHGQIDVLICDWLVTSQSAESSFTSEGILNLDTQGLILNIEDSYGIWAHYYIDYASGNRDRILNQTEFDSYFEMYAEEGGGDCINAEIGNAWTMNGQLVEKDHSYCDFTFDDTGIQFTAYVLLNGSWQADANGEWVLEIYTGDIYSNCTVEESGTFEDEEGNIHSNGPGTWRCVSHQLKSHYYNNNADAEDVCKQNQSTDKWACKMSYRPEEEPPEEYDSCERREYNGGDWIEFECQNEGKYRIEHYELDECSNHTTGHYCKRIQERWQSFDGDGETCQWNADDMYWNCDKDGYYYCENEPNSDSSDVSDEFTWHCTYDFGSDESFGNTTGNTHYSDETMPSVVNIQNIRYGVTSSDSFDLINAKFVRDDGVSLMMAVSSGSAYVDIPYRWDGLDHGRFVWTAASDDSSNETQDVTDDSNNTSIENRLPVCDVFAVSNVGASGQIAASDIASKLAGNTALTAPLTGTLTVPLAAGSYEFMVDCTDPDGDDLVISITDGTTTVTAEAMDGHFYGGLGFIVKEESTFTHEVTVTWTDGTESGEVKVTFTTDMTDVSEETASTVGGLPGFTASLSMLALLGAAMLLGRQRKDE